MNTTTWLNRAKYIPFLFVVLMSICYFSAHPKDLTEWSLCAVTCLVFSVGFVLTLWLVELRGKI